MYPWKHDPGVLDFLSMSGEMILFCWSSCPYQSLHAITVHFCTGYVMAPLVAQGAAGTERFKDGSRKRVDSRVAVCAHVVLSRGASGYREGQQENAWISNRIDAFHDGVSAGRTALQARKRPPARWAGRHVASVVAPSGGRGGPHKSGPCGWKTIQKHEVKKFLV